MSTDEQTTSDNAGPVSRDEFNQLRRKLYSLDDYHHKHLGGRVDDLENELVEKTQRIAELERQVAELDEAVETLAGLGEDEKSTPEKRVSDLKYAMRKRAENASRDGVKLTYTDVEDALAQLGHCSLHDPQLYRAMENAADFDGYALTTKRVDGSDVKAIRLDMTALAGEAAVNEINNVKGVAAGTDGGVNETTVDD